MDAQTFIDQANAPEGVLPWDQSVKLSFDILADLVAQQKEALEVMVRTCAEQDRLLKTLLKTNRTLLDEIDRLKGQE